MRIAGLIFAGSIATLAAATTPALAKNSNSNSTANANAQKIDDQPVAQGCHAYQQAPDGSWVPLPCQEAGPTSQAPTPHK
ncbi:hypothetical protein [Bradyrhizobium sp.]|uniref:hypothetical protein n=1 Tax=Bradyrhizobium sp. TaxID=376 RepID=UPI003C71E19C